MMILMKVHDASDDGDDDGGSELHLMLRIKVMIRNI